MDEVLINVATDFTRYPGGRFRSKGDGTGEEFRVDKLEPILKKGAHITVNLNGLFSIPPSFLDESFGKIIEGIGLEEFKKRITLILDDDPDSSRELHDIYAKRQKGFLSKKKKC